MPLQREDPARLGAAGPRGLSFHEGIDGPRIATNAAANQAQFAAIRRLWRLRLVECLHRLGPAPLGHFLRIEGVLAAAVLPCTFVTPARWKRAVGLSPGRDKDASRAEAIRRWPAKADLFKLKNSDGVAEAALIAIAGLVREGAR